jgi:sarcosine oxidase subunit delta
LDAVKIMHCPLNGPRNISEFAYGGEVREVPGPQAGADAWADYLYLKDNQPGLTREWWYHVPTSYWFIAERDVRTDEILRTYAPDAVVTGGAK